MATELKRIANEYGPDAVVLQTKLLIRTIAAGAEDASQVRVAGPSEFAGPAYLGIEVDTGLLFDGPRSTPADRATGVWNHIVGPVMADMGSFVIEPKGLDILVRFRVSATSDPPSDDDGEDSGAPVEEARFTFDRGVLDDLVSGSADIDEVPALAVVRYGGHVLASWYRKKPQ